MERQAIINDSTARTTSHATSVLLVTASKHIEMALLCDTLSNHFGTKIDTARTISKNCDARLVLFDAQSIKFNELYQLLRQLSEFIPQSKSAIFNLSSKYPMVNKLAEWPQVFGLFYAKTKTEKLMQGLSEILNGQLKLPHDITHELVKKLRRTPRQSQITPQIDKLTLREKQILVRLKEGYTNLDIAKMLFVSEHTIKSHLYSTYRKLTIKTRLEASNWAMDNLTDFPLVDPRTQRK